MSPGFLWRVKFVGKGGLTLMLGHGHLQFIKNSIQMDNDIDITISSAKISIIRSNLTRSGRFLLKISWTKPISITPNWMWTHFGSTCTSLTSVIQYENACPWWRHLIGLLWGFAQLPTRSIIFPSSHPSGHEMNFMDSICRVRLKLHPCCRTPNSFNAGVLSGKTGMF